MSEKKKRFTVQSPYADYAADNDLCSEEMEKRAAEENIQPDKKQIIRSALTAAALVGMFALIGLIFAGIGSCMMSGQ